jgi:hypothetical protein
MKKLGWHLIKAETGRVSTEQFWVVHNLFVSIQNPANLRFMILRRMEVIGESWIVSVRCNSKSIPVNFNMEERNE